MSPEPPGEFQSVPDFLLVLPSFKESRRLPKYLAALVETLALAPFTTRVLVVDDGSPAGEQRALADAVAPCQRGNCSVCPPLLRPGNGRKGDAILEGWSSAASRWLAFADADGATSAEEVRRVLGDIQSGDPGGSAAYFAVRLTKGPRRVLRSLPRRIASRSFCMLASLALRTAPMDFQCGFKVIPGRVLPLVRGRLEGRGFCFDPALLLALRGQGVPVNQVPIDWSDKPGGTVSAWRNGPGMALGLLRLSLGGARSRSSGAACPR